MSSLLADFEYRATQFQCLARLEARARLSNFYEWLLGQPKLRNIVEQVEETTGAKELLESAQGRTPPQAGSPNQVAGVGLLLIKEMRDGTGADSIGPNHGIWPTFDSSSMQYRYDTVFERYIEPAMRA